MDRDLFRQIWPVFSAEAREHLQVIAEGVRALERAPLEPERLDGIRRLAHSLKGSAASLGLVGIEHVAQALEASLAAVDPLSGLSREARVAGLAAVETIERALDDPPGDSRSSRAELVAALERAAPPATHAVETEAIPVEPTGTLARLEALLPIAARADVPPDLRREAIREGEAVAARLGSERPEVAALARELGNAFGRIAAGGVEGARAAATLAGHLVALRRRCATTPARQAEERPAPPEDGHDVPARNSDRIAAAAARARILVVDDSATARLAVKSLLERAGYAVLPACDGEEALRVLRRSGCELVVSDSQMPRLDGLGLTRAMKGAPATAAIPVILVTSAGSATDRAAGLSVGADGYLAKSDVHSGRLLELVRELLQARR